LFKSSFDILVLLTLVYSLSIKEKETKKHEDILLLFLPTFLVIYSKYCTDRAGELARSAHTQILGFTAEYRSPGGGGGDGVN
jgi:hypothetical protein